jgi:hypothetical protein
MTSPYRIERDRGTEGARQQLAVLREKWPLAFPVQHQDVRPLAMGVARQVAAAMGWSLPYTLGVLGRWRMAPVYCQAVLCGTQGREESCEARGARHGEAEACPGAANRAARAIARPSACSAVAPASSDRTSLTSAAMNSSVYGWRRSP